MNATVTTRKTTAREYKASYELLMDAKRAMNAARFEERFDDMVALQTEIEKYEKGYFAELPTVNVKYSIGGRMYYREVVKLGKSFYEHGRRLPKRFNPQEIEEITDKMTEEMIADSYYY